MGKHITKHLQQSSWPVEKAVTCLSEGEGHLLNEKQLVSESLTVCGGNMLCFTSFPLQLFKSK